MPIEDEHKYLQSHMVCIHAEGHYVTIIYDHATAVHVIHAVVRCLMHCR